MVRYLENYKKNIAIDMRKRGFSYSDIQIKMNIPKSTIVSWIKNIKLTKEQKEKLKNKQIETVKANIQKKFLRTSRLIEEIKISSAQNINRISKRELWLIGIILYWKLRNKNDVRNGVRFTNSDPHLIKLFLKWLQEIGEIEDDEIKFDIFIRNSKKVEAINYWVKITGFSKSYFTHIYIHKNKTKYGLLRIRVSSSSMLARQISGWIKGLQSQLLI